MSENSQEMIIAYCGLACSNCVMYRKGKCAGCHSKRPMNRDCKMKACAMERKYRTCATCSEFKELEECRKLNNLVSRFFGFIFRTNRIRNLYRIREIGLEEFKKEKQRDDRA